MKYVFILGLVATLVALVYGGESQWGHIGPNDYLIAKDKVSKTSIIGFSCSKKYIFKQNKHDALTITAIRVTDRKPKYTAKVNLLSGGPGSKGATLKIESKRNENINVKVEIWGR